MHSFNVQQPIMELRKPRRSLPFVGSNISEKSSTTEKRQKINNNNKNKTVLQATVTKPLLHQNGRTGVTLTLRWTWLHWFESCRGRRRRGTVQRGGRLQLLSNCSGRFGCWAERCGGCHLWDKGKNHTTKTQFDIMLDKMWTTIGNSVGVERKRSRRHLLQPIFPVWDN